MADSTPRPQRLLAAQDASAGGEQGNNSASSRSGVPRIEVPLSTDFAINLNSPVGNDDFVDASERPTNDSPVQQFHEARTEHKDNIPLGNIAAATSGGAVTNKLDTQTPRVDGAEVQQHGHSAIEPAKTGSGDEDGPVSGSEPAVYTTLCVANTENRHRWKITTGYLRKRGVVIPERSTSSAAPGDELLDITVGTVKKLLVADWRNDWETPPSNPNQIRLISMGESLSDEKKLRDHRFHVDGPPRPILLSVKRPLEDDGDGDGDASGKGIGAGGGDEERRSRKCGCCVIM